MPDTEDTNNKSDLNSDSVHGTSASQLATTTTNNMAIFSLVLSFFIPVIAIVLAVIALREIKKIKQSGRGLAIAAIVISIVNTIAMLAFVLIIILAGNSVTNMPLPKSVDSNTPTQKTQTTETSVQLPDGFPKDIPVYPGSTIKFADSFDNSGYSLSLSTTDTIAKVNEYYLIELKAKGWVANDNNLSNDPATFSVGTFDKGISRLQLVTLTEGGVVAVSINVTNQ